MTATPRRSRNKRISLCSATKCNCTKTKCNCYNTNCTFCSNCKQCQLKILYTKIFEKTSIKTLLYSQLTKLVSQLNITKRKHLQKLFKDNNATVEDLVGHIITFFQNYGNTLSQEEQLHDGGKKKRRSQTGKQAKIKEDVVTSEITGLVSVLSEKPSTNTYYEYVKNRLLNILHGLTKLGEKIIGQIFHTIKKTISICTADKTSTVLCSTMFWSLCKTVKSQNMDEIVNNDLLYKMYYSLKILCYLLPTQITIQLPGVDYTYK